MSGAWFLMRLLLSYLGGRWPVRPGTERVRPLIRVGGHKLYDLVEIGTDTLAKFTGTLVGLTSQQRCHELENDQRKQNKFSNGVKNCEKQDIDAAYPGALGAKMLFYIIIHIFLHEYNVDANIADLRCLAKL